jgi:hypothetical protein
MAIKKGDHTMKKLIMIALTALALHQTSNLIGTSITANLNLDQIQTYRQDGSSMTENGVIMNAYDGVTQFVMDYNLNFYKVDNVSPDTDTHIKGDNKTTSAKQFYNSLCDGDCDVKGIMYDDQTGFAAVYRFTAYGNTLSNALYRQKNTNGKLYNHGDKVNNIKKLDVAIDYNTGQVSFDEWIQYQLKSFASTEDFITATNSTDSGGGSVVLDTGVTYNSIFHTAKGNGKYYWNCSYIKNGTLIGSFASNGIVKNVYCPTASTTTDPNNADYKAACNTINNQIISYKATSTV